MTTTSRQSYPSPSPPPHAMPHPNMHPAHFSSPPAAQPPSRNHHHWNYPHPPHPRPAAYAHPASSAYNPHHNPHHPHPHPHSRPPRTPQKHLTEMQIIQRDFPNIHRLIEHQTKTLDMQSQEMNRLSLELQKIQLELNSFKTKEKVPPVILVGKSSDSSSRKSVISINKRTVSREELDSEDVKSNMPCKKRFKRMEDRDVNIEHVLATLQAATCKKFASEHV